MQTSSEYGEQYFENGIAAGVSLYQNYRWLPELTLPMAHHIIQHLGLRAGDSLLDFGCAKGYLVKALRMLGVDAYGCDTSEYAIECADSEIFRYVFWGEIPQSADWIFSKDTLEHLVESELDKFLVDSLAFGKAFHVIPLGDNGSFRVPEYSKDVTHKIAESEQWWIDKFEKHGWILDKFSWAMRGIKENWTKQYPKGNGFFIFRADA